MRLKTRHGLGACGSGIGERAVIPCGHGDLMALNSRFCAESQHHQHDLCTVHGTGMLRCMSGRLKAVLFVSGLLLGLNAAFGLVAMRQLQPVHCQIRAAQSLNGIPLPSCVMTLWQLDNALD
jgi:hypothetical protein